MTRPGGAATAAPPSLSRRMTDGKLQDRPLAGISFMLAAFVTVAIGDALTKASLWATSMVLVRKMSATETDASLLAYINLSLLLMGVVGAPFVWQPVTLAQAGFVLMLAVTLVFGQWLMLRAFRLAPIGVVAPFPYTGIVWATLIGWAFWNEFPAPNVWTGAGILIASGLYVMWRERIRARQKAAARSA